jgi:hypothetical protein
MAWTCTQQEDKSMLTTMPQGASGVKWQGRMPLTETVHAHGTTKDLMHLQQGSAERTPPLLDGIHATQRPRLLGRDEHMRPVGPPTPISSAGLVFAQSGCPAWPGPATPPTSGGSLRSSWGSCGQKSADTMVAVRPWMSASWRRGLSGVESLDTPCTWLLMRLESARSCTARPGDFFNLYY